MRIFELIQKSIEVDILSAEESIEALVNNKEILTDEKIIKIKEYLVTITNKQLSLAKWLEYSRQIKDSNYDRDEKQ
jgi:plasmid maintenance system antidote protein VapI